MAPFIVPEAIATELRGKVVVLTGGASGIGAALTTQLVSAGAHVVFGDIDDAAGISHAESLNSKPTSTQDTATSTTDPTSTSTNGSATASTSPGSAEFRHCDVTAYADIYALFRTAHDRFGRVDHAVANAGIIERGDWLDPELDVDSVGTVQESSAVIDVNVMGVANFARVAVVFLREGRKMARDREKEGGGSGGDKDRGDSSEPSLTLMSSVAGFRDSPGLYLYQTSKHAVLGLMRSMRGVVFGRDGVRVNCVCPGFTESAMTRDIVHVYRDKGVKFQRAEDVAEVIAGLMVSKGMNGKSLYVDEAKAFEFEDGLWDAMEQWLGDEPAGKIKAMGKSMGDGGLARALRASAERKKESTTAE